MTITEEDCIKALRRAQDELGKSPTIDEYMNLDIKPSKSSIIRIFGSWNNAKSESKLNKYYDNRPHKSIHPTFNFDTSGGETVGTVYHRCHCRMNNESVRVHRLIAVAKYGLDNVVDKEVHHKSGHGLDNRPENLELIDSSNHRKKHRSDQTFKFSRDESGKFKKLKQYKHDTR